MKDANIIRNAFIKEEEQLFKFPGELGENVGYFNRGEFVAFKGFEKKGKTFYLWYTAYRAFLTGLNVIFVSLEMNQEQMLRRMWSSIVGQPIKTKEIRIPYFEFDEDEEKYNVYHKKEKIYGIDLSSIEKKQKEYKKYTRSGDIQLLCFPSDSITLNQIESEIINLMYYENFIPDVLVLDYVDIAKTENNRQDYRHQIDEKWVKLRGWGAKYNMLVVTGSQKNEKGQVAEDRRKKGHVSRMIDIDRNDQEEEDGIMHLKVELQREGKRCTEDIIVLTSFEISRPYLDSKLTKKVNLDKYKKI